MLRKLTDKRGFASRMMGLMGKRRRNRPSPVRGRRLSVEPLETRTLLAIVSMSPVGDQGTIVERSGGGVALTFSIAAEEGDDLEAAGHVRVFYTIGGLEPHEYEDGGCGDGSVTIWTEFGQTSAQVTITFLNDAIADGDDTCTITLDSAEAANPYSGGGCCGGGGGGCCCGGGGGCCGTHVAVEAGQEATVTIQDDDDWAIKVEVDPTKPDQIVERGGVSGFSISRVDGGSGRSGDTSYAMAVDIAMSGTANLGSDYWLVGESGYPLVHYWNGSQYVWLTTIPQGSGGVGVALQSINDPVREPDEDAVMSIVRAKSVNQGDGYCEPYLYSGPDGTYGPTGPDATVTIQDDDWWKVGITAAGDVAEPDDDTWAMYEDHFMLTRTKDRAVAYEMDTSYGLQVKVQVPVADPLADPQMIGTYDVDYSLCPGTVYEGENPGELFATFVIPQGATTESIDMAVWNDGRIEDDEDVTLTVLGPAPGAGDPEFTVDAAAASATANIEDNDHWLLSVVSSDPVATERMPDLNADGDPGTDEQDTAEFTFTRYGAQAGDVTYAVEVTFTITETIDPALSATPFGDYSFVVSGPGGDTYLANLLHVATSPPMIIHPLGTCDTVVVHTFKGSIPAWATSAKLKVQPSFDWEDEGELYDPNAGSSPWNQLGETIDLAISDVDWAGLHVPGDTRIGSPSSASAEIKDGAILEVYLDYTRDGSFDARLSVDDEPCFVPLNEDDDNLNYAADKDEYPGNPADYAGVEGEDDLVRGAAFAWIEEHGQFHFDVWLDSPEGAIKLWDDAAKNALLADPLPAFVGTLGTTAYETFWVEGLSIGQSSVTLTADRYEGTERAPGCDGWDAATLLAGFDLDIDSDNNGTIEGSGVEEFLEDHDYALGKMLHYGPETVWALHEARTNNLSDPATFPGEPIYLRLPPGLNPTDPSFRISFDYGLSDVSLWSKAGGSAPSWFHEINPLGERPSPEYLLSQLGYDPQTGIIELYIAAEYDTDVKTYKDTFDHDRPTYDFPATLTYYIRDGLSYTPAYTLTETVQHITAPYGTFYREMNANQDLRDGLAAAVVYGDMDPKKYCLEPQDDELLERLGVDANHRALLITPQDGFHAVLYRDFCDLDYKLSFEGTDPPSIADWINNAANGTGDASSQMIQAVTLATYFSGDRDPKPDETGTAEADKLKHHMTLVGHSLGGALASGAAIASALPAATFNSAGLTPDVLTSVRHIMAPLVSDPGFITTFDMRIAAWDVSNIIRFAEKYDILTLLQSHIDLMPAAIGIHKDLPRPVTSTAMASQRDGYIEELVWVPPASWSSRYEIFVGALDAINATLSGQTSLPSNLWSTVLAAIYAEAFVECHSPDQYIYGILDGYDKLDMYE